MSTKDVIPIWCSAQFTHVFNESSNKYYAKPQRESEQAQKLKAFLEKLDEGFVTRLLNTKCRLWQVTCVQAAAKHNNWLMARVLLKKGAQSGGLDDYGSSVLHQLVCIKDKIPGMSDADYLELLDLIVEQGADPEQTNRSGYTAIQLAAELHCWAAVRKLLMHGARADQFDPQKYSLFHRLAMASDRDIRLEKHIEELTGTLIIRGADINRLGGAKENVAALHLAAERKHWCTVKVFLHFGANPCIPQPEGVSIFHRLVR
ncbi:B-cell lymphoma 3 protein homolog [Babylonia areolata]|uniref:B-cell lymphoma 3 protein homolog n=1 Tax=Babylonia areolata TaxID=304850 RepID=UPI003FCF8FEC